MTSFIACSVDQALSELDTPNFDQKDEQRQAIRAGYDGNDALVFWQTVYTFRRSLCIRLQAQLSQC